MDYVNTAHTANTFTEKAEWHVSPSGTDFGKVPTVDGAYHTSPSKSQILNAFSGPTCQNKASSMLPNSIWSATSAQAYHTQPVPGSVSSSKVHSDNVDGIGCLGPGIDRMLPHYCLRDSVSLLATKTVSTDTEPITDVPLSSLTSIAIKVC